MVYVNAKKYACEACIKGHRSSNCHHNDRPLYEIKKKGRPVSQCDKCREARQARRIHAKCTCELERDVNAAAAAEEKAKRKGKRFVPCPPSLPNGLKDALKASTSSTVETSGPRQPVDALLNPCHCKDIYNCKCRSQSDSSIKLVARTSKPVDPAIFSDGLSALAMVAACCSPAAPPGLPPIAVPYGSSVKVGSIGINPTVESEYTQHMPSSHMGEKSEARTAGPSKRKRSPRSSPVPPYLEASDVTTNLRRLRPIAPASSGKDGPTWPAPVPVQYPPPSSSTIASTTPPTTPADDSHCCCGTRCECAGCNVHSASISRVPTPSWVDDPDETNMIAAPAQMHAPGVKCAETCPTCIDYEGGVELPPLSNVPGVASNARAPAPPYLSAFFARAAALPAPPVHTRSSFDPTNVAVYPSGLFARERSQSTAADENERPRAFGLVRIPKLEECCGGRCGCPEDACGCGDRCEGCCMDGVERIAEDVDGGEGAQATPRLSPSVSFARQPEEIAPASNSTSNTYTSKSCCGG